MSLSCCVKNKVKTLSSLIIVTASNTSVNQTWLLSEWEQQIPALGSTSAVVAAVSSLLASYSSHCWVWRWSNDQTFRAHLIFLKYEAAVDVGLWLHLRKRSLCEVNCMTSDLCLPEYLRTRIRCLLICSFFSQTNRDDGQRQKVSSDYKNWKHGLLCSKTFSFILTNNISLQYIMNNEYWRCCQCPPQATQLITAIIQTSRRFSWSKV